MSRRHRHNLPAMTFFSFQDIIACTTGIMILVTLLLALELITRTPNPPSPLPSTPELTRAVRNAEQNLKDLQRTIEANKQEIDRRAAGEVVTASQVVALEKKVAGTGVNKNIAIEEVQRLQAAARRLRRERDAEKLAVQGFSERVKEAKKVVAKSPPYTVLEGNPSKKPLLVEVAAGGLTVGELPVGSKARAQEIARFRGAGALGALLTWARRRSPDSEYFVLLVRSKGVDHFGPLQRGLNAAGFDVGWDVWPAHKSLFTRQ